MAPHPWTANTLDPAGYQVDDLIIELGPRRVRRAETVIRLPALSFDLLVTLVRAAPNVVSLEELRERVWPGLVVTPETTVQRVKLLRRALGDDPHAPHYIEGVRSRGYRLIADVRALTERQGTPKFTIPRLFKGRKEKESPNAHAGTAITGASSTSSRSGTPPAAPRGPIWVLPGWIGGTLTIVLLLIMSWTIVHYHGLSESAGRTSSRTAPAAIHSLVVLPLENLSGDKEHEYFADGMTDALTTDLAQIGSLRVISRTSAMHFKASKATVPQIGHDLHVDAVVEGMVARGDNRVRVTARLVEVPTDQLLWARTYERDLKDVLALQDEIARDITEQIRLKLSAKQRSRLMQAHTVDPQAYDDTLRGWYWLHQHKAEHVRDHKAANAHKALDYFQKAIAKDPGYALAYAGLANSFLTLGFGRELPRKEAFTKAWRAAIRALAIDPSLAEGHTTVAMYKFFVDWDWSGAEAEFKQAIALDPNSADAHAWYSWYLLAMGRLDEAMREIKRAQDLDPFSASITFWLGQVLYHARRYDDALRQDRLGSEMYPDYGRFYMAMADVYEQKGMFAEAFTARQQALTLYNDPNVAALAEAYRRSGYKGYLAKQAQLHVYAIIPSYVAHVYALLDDEPHAMNALESVYRKHSFALLFMRTAPELDSIRSSPRFRKLARRIGLPTLPTDKKLNHK